MERSRNLRNVALLGAILLAAGLYSPVRAQDPDDMQRGVARISLMNGEVSVRRGDSGDWVAGIINAPLLSDDRISTAPNSRAEVQFDSANILRIGGDAEVRLTQLEAGRYQMEVAHGTVTFRVLRPSEANVEVDTPNVSVRPSKQGVYRISVSENGETLVASRAGEVEIFTPRGSQWVTAGQMMVARGTPADPEFQIVNAMPLDEWDRWNDNRDRGLLQSISNQYVGPGVYGAEDLDNNGTWQDVAPYGPVWHPTTVGADWAPYQAGRWVWEDWYGWTWVSYDPWGWAPYHYGRWFNQPGFGWCWYPGLRGVRHYWSPALVGFFGFGGGGIGVGFGFGHVGWVPLAPYEVFHPWWGRNYYGRNVFAGNHFTNVNVTNVYRNARVAGGISAVSAGDFRSGRYGNVMRVSGNQVREAGLIRGQVPIAPTSGNLNFSNRTVRNVPRSNENARFFTHQQPNAAQRVPFSQQQRSFESGSRGVEAGNRGQTPGGFNQAPGNRGGVTQNDVRGGQQPAAMPRGQQGTPSGNSGGWRRFGEPAGQNSSQQTAAPRAQNNFRGSTPNNGSPNAASPSRSMPNNRFENTRPPSASETPANRGGGWQRFGEPASRQAAPAQQRSGSQGNYGSPRYSAPESRQSAPSYSSPRGYSAPAPRQSAPGNSAPRSAPSYSSPRSSGGGGGGSARPSGGGGGHSGGGGGGNRGHR
ncbi:MAG TPA: DUF6600 domain-containing protein [Bryobacteraceae bacterium]